jgi:hypothetical protein
MKTHRNLKIAKTALQSLCGGAKERAVMADLATGGGHNARTKSVILQIAGYANVVNNVAITESWVYLITWALSLDAFLTVCLTCF